MRRGIVWVFLLSLIGLGGVWTAHGATFNSTNFSVNGSIGDSAAGAQASTNYKLTSTTGQSIVGQGSSGSYNLGEGYVAQLENALQLTVQPGGLVGYWSFDQGVGTTIVDDSANSNPALTTGTPSYTAGKVGQAMSGFSSTSYLDAAHSGAYNVSALTSCIWMNIAGTSTNPIAFARSLGSPDTDGMWSIGFNGGLTPRVRLYLNGTVNTVLSNSTVTTGSWNHVCMTYDGSDLIMYQNGQESGRQALAGSLASFTRSVTFGQVSGGSQPFNGSIDEAKIFSRALSAREIKAEYDASNAGLPAGVSLGSLTPGVSQTSVFDSIVQTGAGGYTLAVNQNANLTSGGNTIPSVGGSIGTPVSWSEGTTKGLGFTLYGTNATALPGSWGAGGSYAALPASATSFYTRSGYTAGAKDVINMRLRLDTLASQVPGDYTNQMIITGTMLP